MRIAWILAYSVERIEIDECWIKTVGCVERVGGYDGWRLLLYKEKHSQYNGHLTFTTLTRYIEQIGRRKTWNIFLLLDESTWRERWN